MKTYKRKRTLLTALLAVALVLFTAAGADSKQPKPRVADSGASGPVVVIEVKGVIGHATMNFVERAVRRAEQVDAACLLIEIDTPGGLMESMKEIATSMINARVPVVVYVYPNGATATSAGFFILMASDFAAMAPSTSTGSAHPVSVGAQQMDDTMKEKTTNYAVKLVQQYAERRGRNTALASSAVRKSISVTAEEALKRDAIELIAVDENDLLQQLDGRKLVKGEQLNVRVKLEHADPALLSELGKNGIATKGEKEVTVDLLKADRRLEGMLRSRGYIARGGQSYTLKTAKAPIERLPMSFKELFFQIIGNPQIAYILMIIGVYGLIFEVTHPGAYAPGVIGVICLLIAFTAFQIIPINSIGLILILAAFGMFFAEIFVPSLGLLTVGGIALMIAGSLMLVDSTDPAMKISVWLIATVVGFTVLLIVVALAAVIKTHRGKVVTGAQGMVGLKGKVIVDIAPTGKVFVRGEIWYAVSESRENLPKDTEIEVTAVDGMTLTVREKRP